MKPIQHAQIAAAEAQVDRLLDSASRLVERARTLYNLAASDRSPIPARLRWRRGWLPARLRAKGDGTQ